MTTTAATTSASSSTPNDSPIQDNNGASEPIIEQQQQQQQQQQQSSSNKPRQQANIEQKRPMNAFLLFCKRQRSLVREKYPNLENRGITKILGDSWSKLDKEQKSKYSDLARQHKEAFMKANPDFKWCKTPMTNSNSTANTGDCFTAANSRNHGSSPSLNHNDTTQSNHRDTLTNNRQQEAPKPPKKRFLERNDSRQTKSNLSDDEPIPHVRDGVVPNISIDQETLDRVIEEAFSEKSTSGPTGLNMCKCPNTISTNSISPLGVNSTSFTTSTITTTTSSSSTSPSPSSYSNYTDEPVDFSMSRTFNATGQQIINNLVEKMLSQPQADPTGSASRLNGVESLHCHIGLPLKRESPGNT